MIASLSQTNTQQSEASEASSPAPHDGKMDSFAPVRQRAVIFGHVPLIFLVEQVDFCQKQNWRDTTNAVIVVERRAIAT